MIRKMTSSILSLELLLLPLKILAIKLSYPHLLLKSTHEYTLLIKLVIILYNFFTYKNILAEKNYKNELFLPLNKQKRKKMNTNCSNIDFFPNDLFTSTSSTSLNKADSLIQKKPKKTSAIISRERLAKKLGLMRKK